MITDFFKLKAEVTTKKSSDKPSKILSKLHTLLRCIILNVNNTIHEGCNETWHRYAIWDILQKYNTFDFQKRDKDRVIVCMTDSALNAGIADRIRTMITAYVLACESGKRFYIYHDKGFRLEDYLLPNEVDWRIDINSISNGLNKVAFMFFLKTFRKLPRFRECHVYASENVIDNGFLPAKMEGKYTDHSVFNKLFTFHPRVVDYSKRVMEALGIRESEYIAVHIRFLNFFEAVEVVDHQRGSIEEQEEMILSLSHTFERIHKETKKGIVLFCDSNKYLNLPHPSFVRVLPGDVGHVVKHSGNAAITLKAFSDLYIMSKAAAVYSIIGKNIYDPGFCANGFSRLGAYIGNIPLVRYHRELLIADSNVAQ